MKVVSSLLGIIWGLSASLAHADVRITPKHLVILRPGVDAVWGSYIFAVQNTDQETQTLKSVVMLPKETVDFMPQEGLKPEQLSLADGGIVIDAPFPNGVHIVSIGFKVDARFNDADLTFVPPEEVGSFTVLLPRGSDLKLTTAGLVKDDDENSPDPQYEAYTSQLPLPGGKPFVVSVSGLPEGRSRLWIAGGAVGGLLVVLALIMALRTRPKVTGEGAESVLVG